MATFTFANKWFHFDGLYVPAGLESQFTITVPDGEVINSGDWVTIAGPSSSSIWQYIGMREDGSAGFGEDNEVILELTNYARIEGSPFPSADAFDTSLPLVCFLPGTLIATPDGAKPVEELAIGDLLLTAEGRAVQVKWIGRQTVHKIFGMAEGRRPVFISAGALGMNLPARDLKLTSDHALLIDGVLVHAGALVNGTTIRRMTLAELGQRFAVYHVETENHEVILAEGTPAETFIDNVSRARFDNYAEYETLYGPTPAPMEELSQPRAMSRRQVPASIHARMAAAAAQIRQATSQAA